MTGAEVRARARTGQWRGTTRGAAPGHIQCNVAILPAEAATDFAGWCDQNRSVAPILARSKPGDPRMPDLGEVDLRYDLPAYEAFERGASTGELQDLDGCWTDDLVGFAFGCSFSLEDALRASGVSLRYEERGFGGAIYETGVETEPVGAFAGKLIVSMRPLRAADAVKAVEISQCYPMLHGAPVHVGEPEAIGVDLDRPLDTIGNVDVAFDEVPVFWACGVSAQRAIAHARPPRAYTHVSGKMLVSDLRLP